jgi:lipoprotein-releasing system permease protein
LLSKSDNNAINYITIIAAFGVIIGSAALFIVLSGFAGLKDFSLQFSSIVDPDLKAIPSIGKTFSISENDIKNLNNLEDIAFFSKTVEERVFVEFNDKNTIASIKGVDVNFSKVNTVDSIIPLGSWLSQDVNQVVAGWGISQNLSFGVLDYAKTLQIYVPKPGKGQISSVKSAFNSISVINVGIFDIDEKLNNKYIFSNIKTAQRLLNYKPNQVSAIEFKLNENADTEKVKTQLYTIFGKETIVIKNREQLNEALYKMLNTEYLAVYLIFTLVLIIALFNIIGSIIMMILDKKNNIKTLFNLGATIDSIRKIFFIQGSLMTIIGGLLGLLLGLITIWLQKAFSLIMITPSLPYPVTIKFVNIIIVAFTIAVLGIAASKIASSRISKSFVETH